MMSKIAILKSLIENGSMNIRDVSKKLDIDYKNTYNIIMGLHKSNAISLKRFGKAVSCSVNKTAHPLIYETEYERRKILLKNANLQILYEKLNEMKFNFVALIFGSYSKGKTTRKSDIDVLIISEKNREKEIDGKISLLPLPIHATYLTLEEFTKMSKSKEFTVVAEVMKSNVILVGIEDYYRLIENVG